MKRNGRRAVIRTYSTYPPYIAALKELAALEGTSGSAVLRRLIVEEAVRQGIRQKKKAPAAPEPS